MCYTLVDIEGKMDFKGMFISQEEHQMKEKL